VQAAKKKQQNESNQNNGEQRNEYDGWRWMTVGATRSGVKGKIIYRFPALEMEARKDSLSLAFSSFLSSLKMINNVKCSTSWHEHP
jgi:hypothetical protein